MFLLAKVFTFWYFFPEIAKVRASLFQINGVKKEPLILPEPEGPVTTLTEKVYVPVKEHPDVSIFRKKVITYTDYVDYGGNYEEKKFKIILRIVDMS